MNSEIVVEHPGGQQIVSVITKDSVTRLGLNVGSEAIVIAKASDVMIATDGSKLVE